MLCQQLHMSLHLLLRITGEAIDWLLPCQHEGGCYLFCRHVACSPGISLSETTETSTLVAEGTEETECLKAWCLQKIRAC